MQYASTVVKMHLIGIIAVAAIVATAPVRAQDYDKLTVDELIELGTDHYQSGRLTLALDSLAAAESRIDPTADPARAAQVSDATGVVFLNQGRLPQAIERLSSGLANARDAGRPELEASILNNLGMTQVAANYALRF